FLGAQLSLVLCEVTLLLRESFLPSRQLPDRGKRILLFRLALARGISRGALLLVIGLLLLTQFLIEERRQIRRLAVAVPAAAVGLLQGNLPAANFRGGLQ